MDPRRAGENDWDMSGFDYNASQQQQFGNFEYNYGNQFGSQGTSGDSYANASPYSAPTEAPSYFVPQPVGSGVNFDAKDNFEDEPPLLEELGINPYHIIEKTRAVLNPLRNTDALILQDADIVGPVIFCILFGFILLLSGKIHFGYIYGIGVIGCLAIFFLLNMMSVAGVSLGITVSVLGYCLLPMVGLAGVNLLLSLQGLAGTIISAISVLWCSLSASKLFVTALGLQKQQPLVAYPCALLYGVFALMAIF